METIGWKDFIEAILGEVIDRLKFEWEVSYDFEVDDLAVERPADLANGDFASSLALKLAGRLKRPPRQIAEQIADHVRRLIVEQRGDEGDTFLDPFQRVEVAGPGFINFYLSRAALQSTVIDILVAGEHYGSDFFAEDAEAVNLEYVSANPTGPMHLGHARWAALGNAIANILEFGGLAVTREFYINDAGHQMEVFGKSIDYRLRELSGAEVGPAPEEFYGGQYVVEIAEQLLDEDGSSLLDADAAERILRCREYGYQLMLGQTQRFLSGLGIDFDVWFSERSLYQPDSKGDSAVSRMLNGLAERGLLERRDGALWFKSSELGDDKDRVLVKSDQSLTYFAPDIAYHLDKFERLEDPEGILIDIWGADHHGYVARMRAALAAFGLPDGTPEVLLGQLVNLFRAGEPVRMSKRSGDMVTFAELVDEVGPDATIFLLLTKEPNQPIDFDIEQAKQQDASNPVYYVQYAHARICSLFAKADPADLEIALETGRELAGLDDPHELALMRKLGQFSEVVEEAAFDLAPHKLTHYAYELAADFHKFYTQVNILGAEQDLRRQRLALCAACLQIIETCLRLLGVSAPEQM
ncbi:MAG: arginine--tRNA ligase [Coriobacteriales bacterium]|jgi:arginyl-tRNA synthetase|nr:arginine--tRNA ligase [Coriobacteriales bacterium]